MKQRILALLLAAGLCLGIIGACIPAALAADETGVEEAVEVLAGLGIVSGCSDGSYHPEDNLTRAQFCKLAVLAEGHGDKINAGAYRTLFSDVPGSNWAAPYVNLAYEEGLVSGYGDGTFGPDDAVTTAQAATIVLHLLGYTDDAIGPFWPEDAMSLADSLGLLDGLDKTAARALSRGDAALLLYHLLDQTTADGRDYYTALCSSAIKNALLLDNDSEASDGTLHTALVYADNALTCYEQADCLPELLVGRKGTLLLDSAGKVSGFLPDDTVCRQVVPVKTTSSALTGADGAEYSVNSALPVLLDGEKKTYGDCWYDLAGRARTTLYYASSGNLELIVASEAVAYEGVTLTGYYENAAPNTGSPTRITLLGITLDVADTARAGLSRFAVGDRLTVVLNGAGEVAAAHTTSEKKGELYGVLGSDGSVALTCGLTVKGTIASGSAQAGDLVKVSSIGVNQLSVNALSKSCRYSLNVSAAALGSIPLSDGVKIYERVGAGPVVEIGLDDILSDTVSSARIDFYATDDEGRVCLLLLDDATGYAYTYGFLVADTKTSAGISSDDTVTNKTIAVKNSAGTTQAYITGLSLKNGDVGGIAGTAKGTLAGAVTLTKARNIARSAFDGGDAVVVDEIRVPLADNVQVYNTATGRWTTLEAAKSYADRFTVYYSGALGANARVWVICTE